MADSDPVDLLDEWFQWWSDTDSAPAKMPNALHIRTAIALLVHGRIEEGNPLQRILHDSPYECEDCGGPSAATSMSGCPWCGSQGNIVPAGQALHRTWRPAHV